MWGSLPLQQPHYDEDHQDEDQEGHGEADVERQVGGGDLSLAGILLLTVRVLKDGKILAELRAAHEASAVLAGDVLPLAVTATVSWGRVRAGPSSEGETVGGAGGPGAPPSPVSVDRRADLGAGLLLYGGALTPGASLDVHWLRRVAGPLPDLDTTAALHIALGPGCPVTPATGI